MRSALDGSGPALLPVPAGPERVRSELLGAMRPDDPTAPLETGDAAFVVPTSGSSGQPTGVVLGGAAVRAAASATEDRLAGPGRWVLALPVTHVAGLMVVARAVLAGHDALEVDISAGFDVGAFASVTASAARARTPGATPLYVSLVPTQLARLLDARVDLAPFAAVLVGAAATSPQLLDRAAAARVNVVTTYGLSETCGGCVYDGRPLRGVTADVNRSGRIRVGGPTLFSGYRLRPDLTASRVDGAGRFLTGDLGRRAADGRLEVLGRLDDVIVTGGEKVVPSRVEAVLAGLPGIRACAVVGVPDSTWGERVVAVVEPDPGGALPDLAEVRRAAAPGLPAAWLPRDLVATATLPMLVTGKVDRAAVRELAAARGSATRP
jgi:o-succinylbenzoate---CoA ligase